MYSTDAMGYGSFPLDFPVPDGFCWPYPSRCGYEHTQRPCAVHGGAGLLVYFLSGGGLLRAAGWEAEFLPDYVCALADGGALSILPAEPTEYLYLALENAGGLLARLADGAPARPVPAKSRADRLFGRLCYNAAAKKLPDIYAASADAYTLLMELLARCGQAQAAYSPLVRQALALMREEYAFLAGVDGVAQALGVSKSHLIRQFTAAVGVSPGRYLQSVKLDNAKLMLQNRDYSIETVADMVGYSGANYFCKVFRRETGETPGQFRARSLAPPVLDAESRRRIEELEGITHI